MLDTTPTPPATIPGRPKVLVIDDELGPRESMSYLLQDEFSVQTADRVDRGLDLIRKESFAVVVMDIRMPQKNGIQGLEELRRIDSDVAVIMMTGYGALASAQAAISLGANEYLKKPFDVDVLQAAVRRHAAQALERKKRASLFRQLEGMYESVKTEQKKNQMQVGYGQAAAEMVHDICNPLVVTIGYTNMLLDEAQSLPGSSASVDRIVHYAQRLEHCSSFCLHLAESWRQSAKHVAKSDTFALRDAAEETRAVLFFDSPRIEIEGDADVAITGVRYEIMRVLQNLIKNALEAGATRVMLSVRKNPGRAVLAIADNGSGLPPDVMAVILKKPIESTKPHGTGLGMTICRHIAVAHHAEMRVETRPGGGTVFTLDFPLASN
ncbi:response regulator [Opitutus sp. GAS368]|jgi:signal transduction histidine kinase|uniref:ATP-binding response regulator n=1 Tax=Opitutus sp. GAS368 TaxID=1882749 RepID=UPI00087B928B|nr:response regulator [Opitutus sp. GAS368]SDS22076.1 Signal transduction histidine kinase [Opitutus sp. GAS368]